MNAKLYLSIIAISSSFLICAQSKLKFENNNMVGLLSGESGNSWQLQTINGISYKRYSLGLGVGIDHYYAETIPLFADLRASLYQKGQTPFVYLDLGTNFPTQKDEVTTWQTTTYDPGFYYDFGCGYKWTLKKHLYINASFGYSKKKYGMKDEYHSVGTDVYPNLYEYQLQRFSMKMGLGF